MNTDDYVGLGNPSEVKCNVMLNNVYEGVSDICSLGEDKIALLSLSGSLYIIGFKQPLLESPTILRVISLESLAKDSIPDI
jgi:hypothetical protein